MWSIYFARILCIWFSRMLLWLCILPCGVWKGGIGIEKGWGRQGMSEWVGKKDYRMEKWYLLPRIRTTFLHLEATLSPRLSQKVFSPTSFGGSRKTRSIVSHLYGTKLSAWLIHWHSDCFMVNNELSSEHHDSLTKFPKSPNPSVPLFLTEINSKILTELDC